ncbi:MAG: ATP-grasp domain-containing protein [Candidatus Aenigmarchaeota archaeon]|nr:ATP-grasp domain-containing protein [Candidatus Aenigmarchaeota archaeon]
MEMFTVFATGAGAPGNYGLIKALRIGAREEGRKLRIITADINPEAYGFHLANKCYVIPRGDSPDFIPKMLEICRKERPSVLFSWVDPELLPLSKAKKEFESLGTRVALSEPKAIETSQNKGKCYEFFRNDGITPEFGFAKNSAEFERVVKKLGFPKKPVCFKPSVSYGMRGFRILKPSASRGEILFKEKPDSAFADFGDIMGILKEYEKKSQIPELLVMEYLEGKEYTVDILLEKGRPVITIPRLRVVTKQGVSTVAVIEKNAEVIQKTELVAKRLGLNFNANIQFRYSGSGQSGEAKLIEVQPRLAGTTVACVGAGANLPYLGLKISLGEKIQVPQVKWGTVMKRFWEEVYSDGKGSWFLKME